MNPWVALGTALALCVAFVPAETAVPAADTQWHVWTAPQMQRVGRHTAPQAGSTVELWCAGGEYEAFQIVVTAGRVPVEQVDLRASDLIESPRTKLPSDIFTFYREHYVNIAKGSPDPGVGNRPEGKGWYADALIPRIDPETHKPPRGATESFPFRVASNENQPIWVDVHVPAGARPGVYRGSIHVESSQGNARVSVVLHVWGFSLPLAPTLKSSFGMHEPSLSDPHVQRLLLGHRVMPFLVSPTTAAEFQRSMGLNITALPFWGGSDRQTCKMDAAPTVERFSVERAKYPSGTPLYVYPADEIDPCPTLYETVRHWAANMHAADPRIQNLVTMAPVPALFDDGTHTGRSAVDIWVVLPKLYVAGTQRVAMAKAKGDEIWSYTALVQDSYSPKWEIDFAPINYRVMPGFLNASLGVTGILYWRVDLWTQSPWQDVSGFSEDGYTYPGEGMLIYPGAQAGVKSVVPSMRLKWIRKGVEDYEYVAMLDRMGHGEWARARIATVAKDWQNWTKDPATLESIHRELGNEIARLVAAGRGTNRPK